MYNPYKPEEERYYCDDCYYNRNSICTLTNVYRTQYASKCKDFR